MLTGDLALLVVYIVQSSDFDSLDLNYLLHEVLDITFIATDLLVI